MDGFENPWATPRSRRDFSPGCRRRVVMGTRGPKEPRPSDKIMLEIGGRFERTWVRASPGARFWGHGVLLSLRGSCPGPCLISLRARLILPGLSEMGLGPVQRGSAPRLLKVFSWGRSASWCVGTSRGNGIWRVGRLPESRVQLVSRRRRGGRRRRYLGLRRQHHPGGLVGGGSAKLGFQRPLSESRGVRRILAEVVPT